MATLYFKSADSDMNQKSGPQIFFHCPKLFSDTGVFTCLCSLQLLH